MVGFKDYSLTRLSALRDEMQALASPCPTLREAAQACVGRLYQEFSEALVLTRLFATIPYSYLPERERAFARRLAEERDVLDELAEDTMVVALVASRGARNEWDDPGASRHHLAIPLLSASFIQTIPLVGRVLGATVEDVPWLQRQKTLILTETLGKMSHLLVVDDARTTRTSDGYPMVPDQTFVAQNGIRTVLALGGRYLNGISIALILFTREQIAREQATKFTTLVNTIKTTTMKAVMAGRFF